MYPALTLQVLRQLRSMNQCQGSKNRSRGISSCKVTNLCTLTIINIFVCDMSYTVLVVLFCLVVFSAAQPKCLSELAYQYIFAEDLEQYYSSDFNVISFGDFTTEGGDVEGNVPCTTW